MGPLDHVTPAREAGMRTSVIQATGLARYMGPTFWR